jgi:hypothetical protein
MTTKFEHELVFVYGTLKRGHGNWAKVRWDSGWIETDIPLGDLERVR